MLQTTTWVLLLGQVMLVEETHEVKEYVPPANGSEVSAKMTNNNYVGG